MGKGESRGPRNLRKRELRPRGTSEVTAREAAGAYLSRESKKHQRERSQIRSRDSMFKFQIFCSVFIIVIDEGNIPYGYDNSSDKLS